MKQLTWIFIGWIGLMLTSSCSQFLEEQSQDEVIPTSATDYREILLHYTQRVKYEVLDFLDDDIAIGELGTYENSTLLKYGGCFSWQPDMWEQPKAIGQIGKEYSESYNRIMAYNAVLNGIDEASGSNEEKERVKAEALGLRAYTYFMLVNLFGEPYNHNKTALGVPLKLDAPLIENGLPRNTVEEVYKQIITDLETASALLNKYPKRRGDYYINNTTVDILLSRVCLYMEKWDEAITAASRAIASAEGLTDYTTLSPDDDFYLSTYEHSEVEWLYGAIPTVVGGISQVVAASDLLSGYEARQDKRLELWFDATNKRPKKRDRDGIVPNQSIRLSEAYLNRAEARVSAENADIPGALSDLNNLRRHRIVNYQDISESNNLLEEIREERRLELCFEYHRWFDLRRYGMPPISHDYRTKSTAPWVTYTLRQNDPLYTLPLPRSVMDNNMSLKQNDSAYAPQRGGTQK